MSDEWQEMDTAPKDQLILLDVGLPCPAVAVYNVSREVWLFAQANGTCDYFEAMRCQAPKFWQELPKLRNTTNAN